MYPDMVKIALALIIASQKLRPYFQAHIVDFLTNFPLKQVLQKNKHFRETIKIGHRTE